MSLNEFQNNALRLIRLGLFLLFVIPFAGFGGLYIYTNTSGEQIQLQREVKILQLEIKKAEAEATIIQTKIDGQMEIMRLKAELTEKRDKLQAIAEFRRSTTGQFIIGVQYMFSELWILFGIAGCGLVFWKLAPMFQRQVIVETAGFKGLVYARDSTQLAFKSLEVEEMRIAETICSDEREAGKKFINDSLDVVGKTQKILPKEIIREEPRQIESHVEEAKQLPAFTGTITYAELRQHEYFHKTCLPFGPEITTGNLIQCEPDEATSILITAKPGQGKSFITKCLMTSFMHLYEEGEQIEMIVIDPHWNMPDGLMTFFKPVLNHPIFAKKILGKKAIKDGTVTQTLRELHDETDIRQEKGITTPRKVIVVDEVRLLCLKSKDNPNARENYELLVELLNDRKFGYFCIYITQDFSEKGIGGTGISGLGVTSIVAKSKQSKARILLEEETDKSKGLIKGQAVINLPEADQAVVCQMPLISAQDLVPFMSETKKLRHGTFDEQVETAEMAITFNHEFIRDWMNKKCNSEDRFTQGNFAKQIGISPSMFSRFLNGDYVKDSEQYQKCLSATKTIIKVADVIPMKRAVNDK